MSTLPPYAEPQFHAEAAPVMQRTSTLAVTSLVLAVIACCPVIGLLGPLLGLIALILIVTNPALKGAVFAIAAIIIGIALQAVVGFGLFRGYELLMERPQEFVVAIEADDWTAARAAAGGDAAAATDEQFAVFAAALDDQYGAITSWEFLPPQGAVQPDPNTQMMPWSYRVMTEKAGGATIEFNLLVVDEVSRQFLWRPAGMTITSVSGSAAELTFPPKAPSLPEAVESAIDGAIDAAIDSAAGDDAEAGEDDGGSAP